MYGVYLYSAQCTVCISTVYNVWCVHIQCTMYWVTASVYSIEGIGVLYNIQHRDNTYKCQLSHYWDKGKLFRACVNLYSEHVCFPQKPIIVTISRALCGTITRVKLTIFSFIGECELKVKWTWPTLGSRGVTGIAASLKCILYL